MLPANPAAPADRHAATARKDRPGWTWPRPRWLGAEPRDYRRAFYTVAAALTALFLLACLRGPCLQVCFGHDDMAYLAGGWRVYCGERPYADYHSAMGALDALMLGAGMWLLGPTATVLPFCISLAALALGLLAWSVAQPRLPAWPAAAFAFTQGVVAMAPHHPRFAWFAATYANHYNRLSYAVVSSLLLLLFLPRRAEGGPRDDHWDGGTMGALVGALLFVKITYFMTAVGLCGLALVCGRRCSRALVVSSLAAGGAVVLACLALVRFDALAMFNDLRMAAGARAVRPEIGFTVSRYLGWLPDAWLEIALLTLAQSLTRPPWFFRRADGGAAPSWAEFGGVVGASTFICLTNSINGTRSETPLLTSWLFVLAGYALRADGAARRLAARPEERQGLRVLGSLGGVLWVYTFGPAFFCLCWSISPWQTAWQRTQLSGSRPVESESLGNLRMLGFGGEHQMPVSYAEKINDGLRLLRRLGGTHRVETVDFVNPFPFALQWPAAHGGMWCWERGCTFSEHSCPPPREAFGDADVVMVPRYAGDPPSFEAQTLVYAQYVYDHFHLTEQSEQWFVMQRR